MSVLSGCLTFQISHVIFFNFSITIKKEQGNIKTYYDDTSLPKSLTVFTSNLKHCKD